MTVESTAHARTDDVFEVKVGLPTRDAAGESFTVGAGTDTSVLALAETIRTVADSDSAIVHEGAHQGDIDRRLADISTARERLGCELSVDLATGLATLF